MWAAMSKALLALLAVMHIGGCASVRTLDAAKPGAPVVYAGTRLDRFGAQAPRYPGLDLPASALLDTVLLPLSVLTVLGVGFQASGGL